MHKLCKPPFSITEKGTIMQEHTFKILDMHKRDKFPNTEIYFKFPGTRNEKMHFTAKIQKKSVIKAGVVFRP